MKLFPRLTGAGEVPMAYLVGVGAAVIIGGAVLGHDIYSGMATVNLFDFEEGAQTWTESVYAAAGRGHSTGRDDRHSDVLPVQRSSSR
jgi:hypothetical protein